MTDLTHWVNEFNRKKKWEHMTPAERAAADAERTARIDAVLAQGSEVMEAHEYEEESIGPVTRPPVNYKPNNVTEEDIKAGKTLDGTRKWWPNNVFGTTPHREYTISNYTVFKYNWWRRIEDVRKVYSADGILISTGKKYAFELSSYPKTDKDKQDAIQQLLDATLEYGNVCPGPFTERWVETDSEELDNAQHFINALYDFFSQHSLLSFEDAKHRKQVWEYVKEFENMYVALDHVEKYWTSKNTLGNAKQVKSITKKIKRAMR